MRYLELLGLGQGAQKAVERFAGGFVNRAALVAYHQNGLMLGVWMMAADKGIQTLNAVDQPVRQQKIQCTIYGWWFDRIAFTRETCD